MISQIIHEKKFFPILQMIEFHKSQKDENQMTEKKTSSIPLRGIQRLRKDIQGNQKQNSLNSQMRVNSRVILNQSKQNEIFFRF
jgi:hypothetical protein